MWAKAMMLYFKTSWYFPSETDEDHRKSLVWIELDASEMITVSPMSYHISIWLTCSLMYLFTLMPKELKHAPSISFIKC
jgi:hypothetical protein